MNRFSRKNLYFEIHKMREKCRARNFGYAFSTPFRFLILIILVLRAMTIRLIPNRTAMYFIRQPIGRIPPSAENPGGFVFKVFDQCSDEIVRFAEARAEENEDVVRDIYLDEIESRFAAGVKACCLLNDNNQIVSIFFTSNRTAYVQQVHFYYKPAANEIAITDIYTLKNMRRQGLYLLLLNQAADYFRSENFDSFVMWIMKHNRATIKAQLKAGFTEIFQSVHLFSWLGMRKVTVDTAVMPLNEL